MMTICDVLDIFIQTNERKRRTWDGCLLLRLSHGGNLSLMTTPRLALCFILEMIPKRPSMSVMINVPFFHDDYVRTGTFTIMTNNPHDPAQGYVLMIIAACRIVSVEM